MAFKVCPLCGPKMSMFCMAMCIVGILFLGILGGFFFWRCQTLFEEVGVEAEAFDGKFDSVTFISNVNHKYKSCAFNCWIAAALYVVTLVGTYWQNRWNSST